MVWKFLITLFALSWPFQLLSVFYEHPMDGPGMIMVGIGTFLHCKISKEKYPKLTFGRRKYLIMAILLPFITLLPFTSQKITFKPYILLFSLLNLIPAYGKEVGWRALIMGPNMSLFSTLLVIMAIIGGTLYGVVFAYLYLMAGLIGVTLYHALYDGVRDGLIVMGADPFPWIVIIVGIYLLLTAEKWFSEVRLDV